MKNIVKLLVLAISAMLMFSVIADESSKTETSKSPVLSDELKKDMMGWFDAADTETLKIEANHVAVWKDKSGLGHDLLQETAGSRPLYIKDTGIMAVKGGQMLAKDVTATLNEMTIYAMVKTAPTYSPIIAFRKDNKSEFCAAGWTIGARPTLFTATGSTNGNSEIEDSQWHLLTFIRKGSERCFYVDGIQVGKPTGKDAPSEITDFLLFAYSTAANFQGCLTELLIYKIAHTEKQTEQVNDYLLKKWSMLFPDAKSDLVTFVGNSITTGMYCGNGKTWTAQTAAKIPGLTHWNNISKGGITTQGLGELAPAAIDPQLKRTTGRSVLVFWEGTNDLVVNKATPEAANEAIKQFCLARRKAGWKKVIVMTVLPRDAGGDFETRRISLNQLMRDHYIEYADALVDLSTNTDIGVAECYKNRELYPDGVHTTAKANGIIAEMVAPKLAEFLKVEK
ncbi:MAG: GDSL-type esterase/lipase family protein [bacterium]